MRKSSDATAVRLSNGKLRYATTSTDTDTVVRATAMARTRRRWLRDSARRLDPFNVTAQQSPSRRPRRTASERRLTDSLRNRLLIWVFTVFTETKRSAAISSVVWI